MATLGSLVAGVAHEINNPIGFLNGSINNAQDYLQDLLGHIALYQDHYPNADTAIQEAEEEIELDFLMEDFPKLLASMRGATDRVKGISTSLRTFSRADAEQKVSANLNEGIESTLLILKYRLKANDSRPAIEVVKDYSDIADIQCFPGQLNQVFMNILANAIDALNEASEGRSFAELEEHPPCITVLTQIEQSELTVAISDNGPGIPEPVKERIFENLFTTKAVGKGTGLGLAISRQIVVDNHCGSLSVTSHAGQGTTFLIRLPMDA
ncbi:MAG: ATP-binding protein [Cyanobacteria bacterium J06614_10]